MNLEPLKQWSKSERKNKYCVLGHIYAVKKNGTDELVENRLVNTVGKLRMGQTEKVAMTYIHYRA